MSNRYIQVSALTLLASSRYCTLHASADATIISQRTFSMWTAEEVEEIRLSLISITENVPEKSFRDSVLDEKPIIPTKSIISKADVKNLTDSLITDDGTVPEPDPGQETPPISSSGDENPVCSYTFDIEKQRRPGARHGRGGRPRALTTSELQDTICPQIAREVGRHLLACSDGKMETLTQRLKDAFLRVVNAGESTSSLTIPENYDSAFRTCMKDILRVKKRIGYEIVPAPFLCVCFKVPASENINSGSGNAMDRHTTCTWIDLCGQVHCTCVGSTAYRLTRLPYDESNYEHCFHAKGILRIVSAVSSTFSVHRTKAGIILSQFIILSMDVPSGGPSFMSYTTELPKMHSTHKGSVLVVAGAENPHEPDKTTFIPVRHITKGSIRDICAFCDNVMYADCHHTRTISILRSNMDGEESYMTRQSSREDDDEKDSISHLPLSPVNCQRALQLDKTVCDLSRKSQPYIVTAPFVCAVCRSQRQERTRKLWTNGVLMSTIGPCRMITEEFECSSPSCQEKVISEGRDHYIALDKITSAATHALLRREIHGVVISNGSLTGRLSHFHSLATANAFFGIIPEKPECRSVKTLVRLCTVMLKLMCMSPPKSIFCCQTCEFDGESRREKLKALCMDGISQGFLRTNARPFQNISEPCASIRSSITGSKGRADSRMRPLICLVREQRPVRILLEAIRGNNLRCNRATEKDFVTAVRMVTDSAVPPALYSSISVCGKSRGDVSNDVGCQSVLGHIRQLTTAIFDENILLRRLLMPLKECVQESGLKHYLQAQICGYQNYSSSSDTNGVCWRSSIPNANGGHVRVDLYNLFRMLLQGPVIQVFQKSDTTYLSFLSELCSNQHPDELERALQENGIPKSSENANTNILRRLKVLRAGIFSATEVERSGAHSGLRKSIGAILDDCKNLVIKFYSFYDARSRTGTAFEYRDRWSSTDHNELSVLMQERYGTSEDTQVLLHGNDYELANRTGFYFPGRPQIRPLPFNDEEVTDQDFENIESCSKDFLQRQTSFTPGSLTFCCSCSSPKILGFKVLYRNEGPRAIVDSVISRFSVLPSHLIYDFCCGLFYSAIHCLWWALYQATIVCDNFHFKNHSCSPSYSPRAHTLLQTTNTVSHEQRNRAITRLGLSLRNCKRNLYISLLAYQSIVLNVRAQARSTQNFKNRARYHSEFDIEWCYFHCLNLSCLCCSQ